MRDHPDSAVLLSSARRTLLEQVLPALEAEAQGGALMVARALSVVIARIEMDRRALLAAERGVENEELTALAELLGESAAAAREAFGGASAAVAHLSRRLAAEIRSGAFDPPGARHDLLQRFVFEVTRAKLAESNPKVLQQIETWRKENE